MSTADLNALRQRIDALDDQILDLLAQRFAVTRQVGQWKATHGAQPVDAERERRQRERLSQLARDRDLDPDLVWALFRQVIDAVVAEHRQIAERQGDAARTPTSPATPGGAPAATGTAPRG